MVRTLLPQGALLLAGDDTVDGHKGKGVYGKARPRDTVRSAQSHTAWRYGHKGVALSVLVRFPFAGRPWALPLLVDLYRSPEDDRRRGRPRRTPARLLCRLPHGPPLWLPGRQLIFVGDSGYGSPEVARFCRRHRALRTSVSELSAEANLYGPPPPYRGQGRPRVKGARLPKPHEAVAAAGPRRLTVGLVPPRWVYVRDRTGTHRDEYSSSTDPALTPEAVIGPYTARWGVETTFQELRAHLGLESTRGWCERTVLRAAPCPFGLYTVVALLYQALPAGKRAGGVHWPGKAAVTFSDALTAVRRWLGAGGVFAQAGAAAAVQKLPEPVQESLLSALALAA